MAQVNSLFTTELLEAKKRVAVGSAPPSPAPAPVAPAAVPSTRDPIFTEIVEGRKGDQPMLTMEMEDRIGEIDRLTKLKREAQIEYNRSFGNSPNAKEQMRNITSRLDELTKPGDLTPVEAAKVEYEEQGIPLSNITPWEWMGGYGIGKTVTSLGTRTVKGAVTRGAVAGTAFGLSETGTEIVADAIAEDNPMLGMAISMGVGLTVGNFAELVMDKSTLKVINYAAPKFFSKNIKKITDSNTKNISKLTKEKLAELGVRIDEGDTFALEEAQKLFQDALYKSEDAKMKIANYGQKKDVELSRRQINKNLLKKNFSDINDSDLNDIQKLAEVETMKGFDTGFNKLSNRVNRKLAHEAYTNHPVAQLATRVGRGGGFNEARLTRMVGKETVDKLKKKNLYLITEDGNVDPIKLAVAQGYEDVNEMVLDLATMPTIGNVIKKTAKSMEYDWNLIYLDEFYKRMGGTELKMWEKVGGKNLVNRIRAAVKRGDKTVRGSARTLGAIADEGAALRRIGKKAAQVSGNVAKTNERITQLAKAEVAKETVQQRREIGYLNEKMKNATRNTNIPEDYQEQIHRYLRPYNKKTTLVDDSKTPELRKFLDDKVGEGVPLAKLMRKEYDDVLDLPNNTPNQKDLTLDQYRKVRAMLHDLQRMGNSQKNLTRIAKGKAVNEYVSLISDTANATFKRVKEMPSQRKFLGRKASKATQIREGINNKRDEWMSYLKRPENILRELDAFDDVGPAQRMFRSAKLAEDSEFQISKALTGRWKSIMKKYSENVGKKLSNRFWKQQMTDSMGFFSASRERMITIAAMMGNAHNKRAVLNSLKGKNGKPIDEIVINRFLRENMTEADTQLVEDTWKLTDEMYDMMNGTYKRVTGRTLPKVKNYFPIIPDYKFSTKKGLKEKEDVQDVFMNLPHLKKVDPAVQKRFFKQRVGGSDAIRLDFDALAKHLADVSHTVSHWEVTNDLHKVINDPKFKEMVTANLGANKHTVLKGWVDDLKKPAPSDAPTLKKLRANVTVAMLGFKVSTALVQPLSMVSAIPRVGAGNLAAGAAFFMKNPAKTYKMINSLSSQMASRNKSWNRDLRDLLSSKHMDKFKSMNATDRNVFFSLIRAGDIAGSYTTWYAGWLKGMKKYDGNQNKAIAYADQSVRLTQPQSSVKDLPKIMRSEKEWQRLMTMFYSYYSVLHNQSAELLQRYKVGDASLSEVMSALNYMYIMPPMIKTVMQERTGTDLESMLKGTVTHAAGGMPIVRDIVSSQVMGYDYMTTPAADVIEQLGRTAQTARKAAFDEDYEFDLSDLDAPVKLFGEATGQIPSSQIMNMVRGGHAALNDEDVNILDIIYKKRKSED